MESTTLSMKFCTIGMESVRVQTYILTGPFFKKEAIEIKSRLDKEEFVSNKFYSFEWMVR